MSLRCAPDPVRSMWPWLWFSRSGMAPDCRLQHRHVRPCYHRPGERPAVVRIRPPRPRYLVPRSAVVIRPSPNWIFAIFVISGIVRHNLPTVGNITGSCVEHDAVIRARYISLDGRNQYRVMASVAEPSNDFPALFSSAISPRLKFIRLQLVAHIRFVRIPRHTFAPFPIFHRKMPGTESVP